MRRMDGGATEGIGYAKYGGRYQHLLHFDAPERAPAFRGHGAIEPVEGSTGWSDMTFLSADRFPDTIIRIRTTPGMRNMFGEYVPGVKVEKNFPASVQPMSLKDAEDAGGVSVSERLSVYVPEPDALSAAFGDDAADTVTVDGISFTVESSQSWRRSHTRAILLRAT